MSINNVTCGKMLTCSLQSWNDDKIEDRRRAHNYLYLVIEISCVLDAWDVFRINFHAYHASHVTRKTCSIACVASQVFFYFFYFLRNSHKLYQAARLISNYLWQHPSLRKCGPRYRCKRFFKICTEESYLRPRWASQIWHSEKFHCKSQKS